jgi:hypothetical protein
MKTTSDSDRLFRAVAEYIESIGGSVVVAGPISIMTEPEAKKHSYSLVIGILGMKPPTKKPDLSKMLSESEPE